MKKLYLITPIFAIPAILLLMSYHTGSPGGRSGSPGDNGNTCTGCHTGTANSAFSWITTNVPPEGFIGGQTYTITATGTHPGVSLFGFELTVEDSQGNKVGTLLITDPTRTKLVNSGKAVTHTQNGITPTGNSATWSVDWVAPVGLSDNVGIYAAFNAANGNGNNTGDVIYTSSVFISSFIPEPALVSIVPDHAQQGESILATITAENTEFTGTSPVVTLSLNQNPSEVIEASNVTVVNDTTLTAGFDIPANATAGLWDLNVDELSLAGAFTVNLIASTGETIFAQTRIYPNPASERLFIENARGLESTLFNAQGEIITEAIIAGNLHEMNVNGLPAGFYFLRISDGMNVRVEKLIVN